MMAKRPMLYSIFAMIVVASMLLAGCGGATPTPTAVAQPGNTQPVSTAPQPTQAAKKVATFIWTQEFELPESHVQQYVVFTGYPAVMGLLGLELRPE